MKLSPKTMAILQNYTNIQPSIFIQPGGVLRTIEIDRNICASAVIEDEFPKEFAIYDLPNFLQVLKMFPDPNIEFDEENNFCVIDYPGNSANKVTYMFASPDSVKHTTKDIKTPITEINFKLTSENLDRIQKSATTMELKHVQVVPNGKDKVDIIVTDIDNPTSNNFNLTVDADLSIDDFCVIFNIDYLMHIMGDNYDVGISSQSLSHFSGDTVQYWIALNSNTTF